MIRPGFLRVNCLTPHLVVSLMLVYRTFCKWYVSALNVYMFSEGAVKQGILFSEDAHIMAVDEQKTKGLLAPPKLTLFQVETKFSAGLFIFIYDAPVKTLFLLKEPETHHDQKSVSVSQMKAKRIIDSFENPFRMVRKVEKNNPCYSLFFYIGFVIFYPLFSICPQLMCTSTRMPSLTPHQKYLRSLKAHFMAFS